MHTAMCHLPPSWHIIVTSWKEEQSQLQYGLRCNTNAYWYVALTPFMAYSIVTGWKKSKLNVKMASNAKVYSYVALTSGFIAYHCCKLERRAKPITVWSKKQYKCIPVCATYLLHGIQHCYKMERRPKSKAGWSKMYIVTRHLQTSWHRFVTCRKEEQYGLRCI